MAAARASASETAEDRVRAELRFVRRAVQLDHRRDRGRDLISASKPRVSCAITSLTFATALRTPLPAKRFLSPSRSSVASCSPVHAPLGHNRRGRVRLRKGDLRLDGRIAARIENFETTNVCDFRKFI